MGDTLKLNNKGFAISSIMYIILVLAVLLISLTLALLSSRKLILDKLKKEATNEVYEVYPLTYRETLSTLKEEAITYAGDNEIQKDSIKVSNLNSSVDSDTLTGYKLDNKYLTMVSNNDTYDVYLGESETTTSLNTSNMIDIVDYKISGNSKQGVLPSEYQQVEYIESTGTQYINTLITPTENLEFELESQVISSDHSQRYRHILGSRISGGNNDFAIMVDTQNDYTYRLEYGGITGGNVILANTTSLQKNKIEFKNRTLTINSINYGTAQEFSFTSNIPIYIFALNHGNTADLRNLNLRLFRLKFYKEGNILRDFVPCYRKSDNVVGLYDLVEDKFYVNQGTGNFLKGNNTPTPETPVEIESVGEYDETTGKYKIPVKVSGKNLLNPEWLLESANDDWIAGSYWKRYEQLKPNTTYIIKSYIPADIQNKVTFFIATYKASYDNNQANGDWASSTGTRKATITTDDTGLIIIKRNVSWNSTDQMVLDMFNNPELQIQLEEGDIATDYEPFVEPITTNIYVNEPLRKIGNYADYIDFENKKVVRKIGMKTVDFKYHNFLADNNYLYLKTPVFSDMLANSLDCMSNKIKTFIEFPGGPLKNRLMINVDKVFYYLVVAEESEIQNYIDLLAGMEIYYVLATPDDTEPIQPQKLSTPIIDGNAYIDFGTSLQPTDVEFTILKKIKQL